MNFVNYQQFFADISAWERQLPDFDAVCGVPRSGLIPAAYIALRRNIRLVEFGQLLAAPAEAISSATIRKNNPLTRIHTTLGNRLLVVDDASSDLSVTFTTLRRQLQDAKLQITYGAVYRASSSSKVDLYFREVPAPRLFEWNVWRHSMLCNVLSDMDGVLCEDWKGPAEVTNDAAFISHVKNAKPLYIPARRLRAVVTSRLEQYRGMTEDWLSKHNVKYQQLIMHPAATPELRRKLHDHAERKAKVYKEDTKASLFIESSKTQAEAIYKLTGKPVLCTDTMTMLAQG